MAIVEIILEPLGPIPLLLLFSMMLSEMHPMIGCLAFAGAFAVGVARRPLWMALILTPATVALNLALLLSRWRLSAGLIDTGWAVGSHLLVVLGVVCGGGWVLGRCVSWLARRAMPAQS
jgi:hypothetical protein